MAIKALARLKILSTPGDKEIFNLLNSEAKRIVKLGNLQLDKQTPEKVKYIQGDKSGYKFSTTIVLKNKTLDLEDLKEKFNKGGYTTKIVKGWLEGKSNDGKFSLLTTNHNSNTLYNTIGLHFNQ